MFEPNEIIIHCTDSQWGRREAVDKWHKERGWDGIGYHYLITNGYLYGGGCNYSDYADGDIHIGRPLSKPGAHVIGRNGYSIGICLVGVDKFTPKQYQALRTLCEALMVCYGLSKSDIYGHYEYDENKTCPNFDVNEWVASWNRPESKMEVIYNLESVEADHETRIAALEERVEALENGH